MRRLLLCDTDTPLGKKLNQHFLLKSDTCPPFAEQQSTFVVRGEFPVQHPAFLRLDQTDGVIRMGRMVTKKQSEFVLEAERAKVRPPRLFKVLLLNDDFTPMDFVVVVLQKFFAMDRERATRVMLQVHREGSGVCGVFPKDIAATKVEQVSAFARQHQHPLACVMEEN